MSQERPLIRIPTQPARLTLFGLLVFVGFFIGIYCGIAVGLRCFGILGAIAGAVVGGFLGIALGSLPDHLMKERMFKTMQRASNDELKAMLEQKRWAFWQTLALLNLQVRGEDVEPYLQRILGLLESDDGMKRIFGRDALRLVFTDRAKLLDDCGYNPNASAENCRDKIAEFRAKVI